jgi:hypothetical protein
MSQNFENLVKAIRASKKNMLNETKSYKVPTNNGYFNAFVQNGKLKLAFDGEFNSRRGQRKFMMVNESVYLLKEFESQLIKAYEVNYGEKLILEKYDKIKIDEQVLSQMRKNVSFIQNYVFSHDNVKKTKKGELLGGENSASSSDNIIKEGINFFNKSLLKKGLMEVATKNDERSYMEDDEF